MGHQSHRLYSFLVFLIILFLTIQPVLAAQAPGELYLYCGDQNLFFRNDSSDIAGYKILDHIPELASTQLISTSVSSATSPKTIGTFITPVGQPNVTTIAPGLWRFRTYLYVSSTTGTTTVQFIPFIRSLNGTESELFYGQVISNDINDIIGTPTEFLNSYARRNYTSFEPGDRLGIRVNTSTSSVPSRTTYMSLAGNTQASMVTLGYFECPGITDAGPVDVDHPDSFDSVGVVAVGVGIIAIMAIMMLRRRT